MTTLSSNAPRAYEGGDRNEHPVIASDIIFEGAAVGMVDASGNSRPLVGGDRFQGFAEAKADNSDGTAGAKRVRVIESGKIQLPVTGAVITDDGQPVYATDDNTFTFVPTGGTFIGFVHRFVMAGYAVVAFDAKNFRDPYGGGVYETISANKTLDSADAGKTFFVDTDALTITLPAVANAVASCKIVNIGAFGAVAVNISPAAADSLEGPDITAADNKDLINTKATARRGDHAVIEHVDANGYAATELVGTWAREA